MRNVLIALMSLFLLYSCGRADKLTLESDELAVTFDKSTALVRVKDRRSGKIWEQDRADARKVKSVSLVEGDIVAELDAPVPVAVRIQVAGASLKFILSADPAAAMAQELDYPAPFKTPGKDFYILETDGEGMLLPVTDTTYKRGDGTIYFCGGGLAMPWKGLVDKDFLSGYQVVVETPFDARIEDFVQNDGLMCFKTVWMPSMQALSYDRVLTVNFFDKGGYVAQCKKYREYVWDKQDIVPLTEHAAKYPAVNKMLGAVQTYTWDTGRDVSVIREMKAAGIDRLAVFWDSNHTPYPKPGYDLEIEKLGYCAGGYELFTDLHPRDSVYYDYDWNGPLRLKHGVFPGEFHKLAARKADGSTYSNQFGTYACPLAMRDRIFWKLDRVVKEYPHEALFLDVYQANGLYECYSPEHPLSREGYAKAILENYRMIQEKYGFFMGGEWGADYAIPYSIFNQGMMTLQWPWWGSEIDDKDSPYYYGDWKNHERPSIMLTTTEAGPTYYRWCLNEAIRVPLYELVFHDAAISTWRWEDGNPRYPELWWKKDLFNMLYGTAPLWILDRSLWERFKGRYVESYNQVSPWLSGIAAEEMTDHRFITPDGKVQMSAFSGGKSIIVNFGDTEYEFDGHKIAPRSYVQIPAV